jgi:hypothetical protein
MPNPLNQYKRHCEKRSDEAIQSLRKQTLDCFAPLAMTMLFLTSAVKGTS